MKQDMKQKVKEITEQLEQGVAEVFTSDNFIQYLQVMSKFHDYSFNNCLLIAMQCPTATLVAGYKAWQKKFKRQVRKGEKAIKILAPIPCKITVEDEEGEEKEIKFNRFRAVSVFDIAQTDGEEMPEFVHKLTGDVDGYNELAGKLTSISPVPIRFDVIEGTANGYFSSADKEIVIRKDMSQAQIIKTMVHEIAHSILHDKDNGLEKDANRKTKEVQAESVAYVVSQYLRLDTSDYSFGYIAGWSSDKDTKELKASLQVIRDTAHDIISKVA